MDICYGVFHQAGKSLNAAYMRVDAGIMARIRAHGEPLLEERAGFYHRNRKGGVTACTIERTSRG